MHALLAGVSTDWLKTWPLNHTQHINTPHPHACVCVCSMFKSENKNCGQTVRLSLHKLKAEAVN